MTEVCRQCGNELEGPLPIVAIQAREPGPAPLDALDFGNDFVVWPVCEPCWRTPEIKAHFFFRADMRRGLAGAELQVLRDS